MRLNGEIRRAGARRSGGDGPAAQLTLSLEDERLWPGPNAAALKKPGSAAPAATAAQQPLLDLALPAQMRAHPAGTSTSEPAELFTSAVAKTLKLMRNGTIAEVIISLPPDARTGQALLQIEKFAWRTAQRISLAVENFPYLADSFEKLTGLKGASLRLPGISALRVWRERLSESGTSPELKRIGFLTAVLDESLRLHDYLAAHGGFRFLKYAASRLWALRLAGEREPVLREVYQDGDIAKAYRLMADGSQFALLSFGGPTTAFLALRKQVHTAAESGSAQRLTSDSFLKQAEMNYGKKTAADSSKEQALIEVLTQRLARYPDQQHVIFLEHSSAARLLAGRLSRRLGAPVSVIVRENAAEERRSALAAFNSKASKVLVSTVTAKLDMKGPFYVHLLAPRAGRAALKAIYELAAAQNSSEAWIFAYLAEGSSDRARFFQGRARLR